MKLADICEINPRAEVLDDNTLVSFVAMPDVSEDGKINVDTHRTYGEVKKGFTNFIEGDVLFAKITPCMENGKGALATGLENGLGFGSTEFHVLRPDTAIVLGEWLFYLTSWSAFRKDAEKHMTGSAGQKRVPKSFLVKYEIDVPPIDDQEYQVLQLNRIRKIIDARRQQISALDDLIKARFVEMFGDCKTNPKAWNTVELGDISDVGSSKRVFVEELRETGIPFYRGTEVGALAEGKAITPELFITQEHYEELIEATGKPLVGDLLMPSICPDGRIWVVDTEEPFYFKDGRVLWVHSISKEFDPVFLLYTLKDRIMTDYSSIASGTTFAELKIFALKQCRVFAVPMDQQKQFVSFVKQIDKSKSVIQKSLDETQLLFDSLMQQYFG